MIKSGYININESKHNERYNESTKLMHDNISEDDIKELTSKLSKIDMMNPIKVNKVLSNYKIATSSCYAFSAIVAKLMDHYDISYKCYSGLAFPSKDSRDYKEYLRRNNPKDKEMDTHVWIEINGIYYEYYNGSNSIIHISRNKEIKLK